MVGKMNITKIIVIVVMLSHKSYTDSAKIKILKECKVENGHLIKKRIIGGTVAGIDDYPMIAGLLNYKPNFSASESRMTPLFCAGSLITDRHIMSAAHCLSGVKPKDLIVSIGDFNLSKSVQVVTVKSIVVHPKFKIPYEQDIAIVELTKSVKFTKRVQPALLPPQDFELQLNSTVFVAGWGITALGGRKSQLLRHVELSVYNKTRCSIDANYPFADSVICAGKYSGGQDACQGDSGGPLMTNLDGKKVIVGIVSFGRSCALSGMAAGYTKVSMFIDWIQQVVSKTASCLPAIQEIDK